MDFSDAFANFLDLNLIDWLFGPVDGGSGRGRRLTRKGIVPDVRGLDVAAARARLRAEGFKDKVRQLEPHPAPVMGIVVDQSPGPVSAGTARHPFAWTSRTRLLSNGMAVRAAVDRCGACDLWRDLKGSIAEGPDQRWPRPSDRLLNSLGREQSIRVQRGRAGSIAASPLPALRQLPQHGRLARSGGTESAP